MYQADTHIADEGRRDREKEKVRETLKNCGYPEWTLKKGELRGKTKLRKVQEHEKKGLDCYTAIHERCHRTTPDGIQET